MIEISKRLIDVKEYHKMAEVGILKPTDRVELIHGEIIAISPVGSKHASVVKKLGRILNKHFSEALTIGVQDPVQLSESNEPEPDISVLKYRSDDYAAAHPTAADVLVLMEVSDTTLRYDKEIKAQLYAQSSVPELWIIDINKKRIEIYTQPEGGEYLKKEVQHLKDEVSILDKTFAVKEILG